MNQLDTQQDFQHLVVADFPFICLNQVQVSLNRRIKSRNLRTKIYIINVSKSKTFQDEYGKILSFVRFD